MINLDRVAYEIKTVGLYDLVLQDVQRDIGKNRVSEDEIKALEEEKNKKFNKKNDSIKQERSKKIEDYFSANMSKAERNIAMRDAFLDGYPQTVIAKELGVTSALVSYNIKNLKFDT